MSEFRRGMAAATGTVLGYASIGLACGILATQSGLSPAETALMSLIVYSGSAQFALCGMVAAQTDPVSATLTIGLINLRNLLLNLHTTKVFESYRLPQQLLAASMMTDESYGILLTHQLEVERVEPLWMFGNNGAGYLSWFVFSVLGAMLGGLLPNPERLGIDYALIVMFLAIFASQLDVLSKRVATSRIGVMLISVAGTYLLSSVLVQGSVAVFLATLMGCFVGVLTDVD